MITNKNNKTLYIGVTNNLQRRVYEHRNKLVEGFSSKYNLYKLVYYEEYSNSLDAIEREKYLKGKKRSFKNTLIEKYNPKYEDLYVRFFGQSPQNDSTNSHPEQSEGSKNNTKRFFGQSPQNDGEK